MIVLKVIVGLFAFVGIIIVLIVVVAAVGSGNSHQPQAIIDITSAQMNDQCTVFGDYCVRAVCTYYNRGDGPGERAISAQLFRSGESIASRQSTVTLMPGKAQTLWFDFQEAILDDSSLYSVKCYTQ